MVCLISEEKNIANNQKNFWKDVLNKEGFVNTTYKLPIVLGYDDCGKLVLDDLSVASHILIAGAAGSGI